MKETEILGVFIGKTKDIGAGLASAIDKRRVTQRLWLWRQGMGGDEQSDRRFHGGPERALHHYPAEHYAYWRARYPHLDWQAPNFGENLSSRGLTEEQVCIGDLFRWGDALLQVSQPRSPCYRLARRWGLGELPQLLQDTGRCGWFYRIRKPGFVCAESRFERIHCSHPELSVAQALRDFFHSPQERAGLQRLADCPALSPRWREHAARRLASNQLEDWSARLGGPPAQGLNS